ncbi:MAG: alanine--tRNA ligase [Planctomycetota bacterium]
MTSNEIRQQFFDFFREQGHTIVPSAPVVPLDDPTLLFTNAGMNQFKDVFLGIGARGYVRAADSQKCIRAGGKHNDLDDVGLDTYHHTFFEMLGNWSFGDYFKKEAIQWGWELLTQVWGIDKARLHATYFGGDVTLGLEPDDEARDLWTSVTDIDPTHVHPGGTKDNFWEMGDTGPCGPCSEIHIDLTPDKSGARLVNAGDHRVIEIWNLVFIQFDRGPDGKLTPLPAKHVDTGMGLERLCAVLQGKTSNYDTDVFAPIFRAIQDRTGAPDYRGTVPHPQNDPRIARSSPQITQITQTMHGGESISSAKSAQSADQMMIDVSYRVIADHLRCLTFALTDGAVPSNEGRGYVLRRILRRAVRYGRQYFEMREPFLCDLVESLVEHMGDVFPELRSAHGGKNVQYVADVVREEEESFGRTLDRGIKLFNEAADYALKRHHGVIGGEAAFKLHDTYGFPIDLTELMAQERGLRVDIGEYERLMEEARERARAAAKWSAEGGIFDDPDIREHFLALTRGPTVFAGWSTLVCDAQIVYMARGEPFSTEAWILPPGERGVVVLDRTPFYAEKGGQVGDRGTIVYLAETGQIEAVFTVDDVREFEGRILHYGHCTRGTLHGSSRRADPEGLIDTVRYTRKVRAIVDPVFRNPTMQNHTATHLLNWALREVLGDGVQQKGSLVDHEKTRFDFSHHKPLTVEELTRVEALVNRQIEARDPVYTKEVEQAKAREINTLRAVFGEKYPDVVRVVSAGADIDAMLADPKNPQWMQHAVEFCGGTHLRNTADAERFVLVSEEAVAKGVRRVVGVTGAAANQAEAAGEQLRAELDTLVASGGDLGASLSAFQTKLTEAVLPVRVRQALRERIAELQKQVKGQQKEQATASGEAAMERVAALLKSAETIAGVTVVVGEVPAARPEALRGAIDWVRNKTEASAVLLAAVDEGKVTLLAGMSREAVARGLKAGDLIKEIAPLVGGKGGGRPDMAQGGGNNPAKLSAALDAARAWVRGKLA